MRQFDISRFRGLAYIPNTTSSHTHTHTHTHTLGVGLGKLFQNNLGIIGANFLLRIMQE